VSQNSTSTRRTFLKGGALLAAPISAASVSVATLAADGSADEDLKARLERLEDEAAIRELQQSWLRQFNAGRSRELLDGSVRRLTADLGGGADAIEIAADGRSAVGTFDYAVELEVPLAEDSTLAQMAHAQGHGTVRLTERRMLSVEYTKTSGTWNIGRVTSRTPTLGK
jgi:hypothetical protein